MSIFLFVYICIFSRPPFLESRFGVYVCVYCTVCGGPKTKECDRKHVISLPHPYLTHTQTRTHTLRFLSVSLSPTHPIFLQ